MRVTVMPRSAARKAAAYPPGPAPSIAIWRFVDSGMKGFQSKVPQRCTEKIAAFLRVLGGSMLLSVILARTTGTVVQTLLRSSAGNGPHRLHRSGGDRTTVKVAGSGAARIYH